MLYAVEGCQGAVLRIYRSDEYNVDYETCGQEAPVDNVISENGFIRIKYVLHLNVSTFGGIAAILV